MSVTVFSNGWRTAQNIVAERANRASAEFGEKVVFTEIETTDREVSLEYGISNAMIVNGKAARIGPQPCNANMRKHTS